MSSLKVAAAQIECRSGDIAANIDLHLDAIADAKKAGAGLVVFPELSLTDYALDPDLHALAMDAHAPQLGRIAQACQGIAAIVGFIGRDKDNFYNSAATLSDGRLQTIHSKINLPSYGRLREGGLYSPGHRLDVWSIGRGWRAATLICADSWNPVLPWLLGLKGCDLLLLPIASALDTMDTEFDNPAGWDVNLQHTAMTYGLPIVMCNHCGQRPDMHFWGGSRILDAKGATLARAGHDPEIIYAEVSSDDVAAARERLPTIKAANPELVAELLRQTTNDPTSAAR